MSSNPSHTPLTHDEFVGLASMLRKSTTGFESTIAGTSMEPAIPHAARIKIHPQQEDEYREGQIVACATGNSMFAHRIVYCGRSVRTRAFVVTKGDGWVLCDSPTRRSAIMGEVTAYYWDGVWQTPASGVSATPWNRALGCASLWLIRSALVVHLEFARRVAGTCLVLGGLCKRMAMPWSKAKNGA